MASMAPSEEQISQVIDFAGLNPHDDRTMVIQALKVRLPAASCFCSALRLLLCVLPEHLASMPKLLEPARLTGAYL